MSTVDFSGAVWRKSSRSAGGNNGDCVEVAFAPRPDAWRKSSRSEGGNNGNCVEVNRRPGVIGVRDSKNTAGDHLVFGEQAWREFTAHLG